MEVEDKIIFHWASRGGSSEAITSTFEGTVEYVETHNSKNSKSIVQYSALHTLRSQILLCVVRAMLFAMRFSV